MEVKKGPFFLVEEDGLTGDRIICLFEVLQPTSVRGIVSGSAIVQGLDPDILILKLLIN